MHGKVFSPLTDEWLEICVFVNIGDLKGIFSSLFIALLSFPKLTIGMCFAGLDEMACLLCFYFTFLLKSSSCFIAFSCSLLHYSCDIFQIVYFSMHHGQVQYMIDGKNGEWGRIRDFKKRKKKQRDNYHSLEIKWTLFIFKKCKKCE